MDQQQQQQSAAEISHLQAQLSRLKSDFAYNYDLINERDNEIFTLSEKLDLVQKKLEHKLDECERLRTDHIASLQKEEDLALALSHKEQDLADALRTLELVRTENKTLLNENESMKFELECLKKEPLPTVTTTTATTAAGATSSAAWTREKQILQDALREQQLLVADLSEKKQKLEQSLRCVEDDLHTTRREKNDLQYKTDVERKATEARHAEQVRTLELKLQRLDSLTRTVTTREEELRTHSEKSISDMTSHYQRRIEEMTAEARVTAHDLFTLKQLFAENKSELEAAVRRAATLENQHNEDQARRRSAEEAADVAERRALELQARFDAESKTSEYVKKDLDARHKWELHRATTQLQEEIRSLKSRLSDLVQQHSAKEHEWKQSIDEVRRTHVSKDQVAEIKARAIALEEQLKHQQTLQSDKLDMHKTLSEQKEDSYLRRIHTLEHNLSNVQEQLYEMKQRERMALDEAAKMRDLEHRHRTRNSKLAATLERLEEENGRVRRGMDEVQRDTMKLAEERRRQVISSTVKSGGTGAAAMMLY
eukprot:PhM_4_TR14601/c0_g2_i1/m.31508